MILHDRALKLAIARHELVIEPAPLETAFQPASIDLRLGLSFLILRRDVRVLDSRMPHDAAWHPCRGLELGEALDILPGAFLLATTLEHVTLSARLVGRLEGKSSLGRMGLAVHVTAGFIDPGWRGHLTLELKNHGPATVRLYLGQPIAQLSVMRAEGAAQRPYAGHYQGATGPEASRAFAQYKEHP